MTTINAGRCQACGQDIRIGPEHFVRLLRDKAKTAGGNGVVLSITDTLVIAGIIESLVEEAEGEPNE